MKNRQLIAKFFCFALCLCMVFAMYGCGGGSSGQTQAPGTQAPAAQKFEFSLTLHDPVASPSGKAMQEWADEVNRLTNGNVTITLFGSGQLAPGPEALDYVTSGAAQIGWLYTAFYPGQFPLTEVVSVPMSGFNHPAQTANVLWDLYESTPELQQELSRIKVLEMYGNPVNFLSTKSKPIRTIDDIKGMSLRSPAGGVAEVLQAWGANPIQVGAGDTYGALEKGNIDGTSWEWHGLESFALYEHLNYYMDMPLYEGVFILGMNLDAWNSLPKEYQDIIDNTTQRAGSVAFGEHFHNTALEAKERILEHGGEIVTPDEAAVAEFKVAADEYAANWASSVTTDSFDGAAYFSKALDLAEKYDTY